MVKAFVALNNDQGPLAIFKAVYANYIFLYHYKSQITLPKNTFHFSHNFNLFI